MLPFPRMGIYDNKIDNVVLLDIDFNTSMVGSTECTDRKGAIFSPSGAGSSVVQNDVSKGNVMVFSGGSCFITPMSTKLSLSTKKFELRVVFKSTINQENMVFSTGDYYSAGSIVGGMLMTLFNSSGGSQLFCTTNTGLFTRCLFSYSLSTWRDISFFWNPSTLSMIIYDNDSNLQIGTYSVPNGFGDGNYLCIGASYVRGTNTASFVGSIKSIKITQILD